MELRTRIYSVILAIVVVALVVVGVLLLRKRQTETRVVGGSSAQSTAATDTKPLDSYQVERPWQEGDPVPTTEELNEGLIE